MTKHEIIFDAALKDIKNQDFLKAIEKLTSLVEQGNTTAQSLLRFLYSKGIGV